VNTVAFHHDKLLWLMLFAPVLVLLKLWLDSQASGAVTAFTAARLRPVLISGTSRVLSWVVYSLYLLALCCFVIAIARPRWGSEKIDIPDRGRNIFIAIDTSRSMLAKDANPDRLTRSKLAANDLIRELKGERIGLLAFAGRAYLQAPLTTDHEAILESLQAFDHTVIEWGGSNVADLLDVTLRAIKALPKSNYVLILFSDGGDADANLTAPIQKLTAAQVSVISIGVGTEGGTFIPNPDIPNDYVRDMNGNVVVSKLESGVLQQLASATGGRYLKLGNQPLSRDAVAPIIARLREQENASRATTKPIERFAWPLSLGIVFIMIAWIISSLARRTPQRALIALGILAAGQDVQASSIASMLRQSGPTPEQAKSALHDKDFERARLLYEKLLEGGQYGPTARQELLYGLASAEHNLTDYDGSTKNFSEVLHSNDTSLRTRAHRGLGHTLYDQGALGLAKQPKITLQRWIDSLTHFDAALELDPTNKQLKENRDHVAQMLENLRKALDEMEKKQQGNKGDKGDKGQKGQKGQKGEKGEGQQGEDGEGEGEGSDGSGEGDEKKKEELKGEQKGEDDGIGGKDAKNLPQGRLQAADDKKGEMPGAGEEAGDEKKDGKKGENGPKPGDGSGGDEKKKLAAKEQEKNDRRNPKTGFTPGEAEGLLRQYMDEFMGNISNRQSIPPVNKKDW